MALDMDRSVFYLEEFLENENDNEELRTAIQNILDDYKKKNKRLDRIVRQSDKQQREVMNLNEKLKVAYEELKKYQEKLEKIYKYNINQQLIAKQKVMANISNDLENDDIFNVRILFEASDILGRDFYSLFKKSDGTILFYLIDGQEHGISPSVTVFAIASIFNMYARSDISLEDMLEKILSFSKYFLADEEQLSFTIMELSADTKTLTYAIGGMYPMLVMDNNELKEIKANNLPILNFSSKIQTGQIQLSNFQKILLYTDGIVETEDNNIKKYSPKKLIANHSLLDELSKNINTLKRDDDITVVYINKKTI